MKIRTDTVFYRIGQWIWIPLVTGGFWLAGHGYELHNRIFECVLLQIIGLPCPACGGTRAIYYLFSGNLYESLLNHPVVIYGVLIYFHFMGLYFFRHHFTTKRSGKTNFDGIREIPIAPYIYGAVAVILIQWLIKILRILL